MMQCPKCKTFMRWYMGGGYYTRGDYHCDKCGYDTDDIKYITTNRTDYKKEAADEWGSAGVDAHPAAAGGGGMTREEALRYIQSAAGHLIATDRKVVGMALLKAWDALRANPCDNCVGVGLAVAHGYTDMRLHKEGEE